ncbi:MAG: glucosamine-6-phosphate deaminase [Spirochaetes bacterium]|nr:MAG: glucosamine-6-phosphate deaminase [Spirochaetota bacterium]
MESSPDLNTPEKIPVALFPDPGAASRFVAGEIAALVRARASRGEPCVLGLATGSTPLSVYEELVRMHREEGLSFRHVITFNLDEYHPMDPSSLQSYVRFMKESFFDHVDIDPLNTHIPDGTADGPGIERHCAEYERAIREAGGIDAQILGIGRTGHIGFNEPGSGPDSRTRLVTLDRITVLDAAGDFYGEEHVPSHAITMGVGTILEARKIYLLALGEGKAEIVRACVEGPETDRVPASFLRRHPDARVVLDGASSAGLTRIATPWLTGRCAWDDERLVRRAVAWLCRATSKPILKLTNRDYIDHGMYDLVDRLGDAYSINIRVFNDIQHTITGWPGGKPGTEDANRPERARPFPKRVLIMSPHPDDDVISMGGTLIRLVDQGHEVHVAYQTSGTVAVYDDDAVRFLDFVRDFHDSFGIGSAPARGVCDRVTEFLREKLPADADSDEAMKVKALIRRGEAKAAARYAGIPAENIHFLDMPFYQTGIVKKHSLGERDIALVRDIMRAVRPHQLFAAGDLSDPHGTHRVCFNAILRALDSLAGEDWLRECAVWLYRGAWQEWDIQDVDMAVPLSPQELARKRSAIFKHQSQKDRPLFPGVDEREFWQRAEARNRATAAFYDGLGMAEYEALEVFKRCPMKGTWSGKKSPGG